MENVYNCSVCSCEFDEYAEGGTVGNFGMLPVAFCPTCLACMFNMVETLPYQTCMFNMVEQLKEE